MKFKDFDIDQLNINEVEDFSLLIIHYLCGKQFNPDIIDESKRILLEKIIKDLNSNYLNYEQFNEVLMLFNQDRISEDFFNYFFTGRKLTLDILKSGIVNFRGLSILNFGNFKFTYKKLSKRKESKIDKFLGKYTISSESLEKDYKNRPNPIISIKKINKENTWYLGYISSTLIEKESKYLEDLLKECEDPEEFEPFSNILQKLDTEIQENREMGNHNTNAYLIWDYIDVYIATSMRKNCDFEETFDIIQKTFSDQRIKELKLRYFDPTQSYCELNRDKGLIEGLMLKRANCTIYMVQESDTFGKDSELASTLAQKKPVIAFIPNYEKEELNVKLKNYPLDYIKERILIFKAEDVFNDLEILNELDKDLYELNKLLDKFIKEYDEYRLSQPFSLWYEREEQFKDQNSNFQEVCKILAIFTKKYWNKRAKTLKDYHPLGMQIDLNSGVANGVLVVRDINTCVNVLRCVLTNSLNFEIKHSDEGYTGLIESYSGSIYRIVTDNELLTNSFWNFFFKI